MSTRWIGPIVLLLSLGLVAAACGDDSDSSGTDAQGGESTSTTEAAQETTTSAEGSTTTAAEEEVVLTDSFRGVTADTITVGFTGIDFDRLNGDFGLDLAFQNFTPQYEAIIDWYNERGGVLGRQIEMVPHLYVPVGATTADEVCVKLTEDTEIFAVLGGFAGPGAEDVNECFTELHETILVGGAPRADQAERAGGLWVSTDIAEDRRNPAVARLMAEAGVLEDLGTMAVIGSNPDELDVTDGMAESLRAEGVEVGFTDVVSTTGDRAATTADVNVWIEKARSDGISTIVLLGEGEYRNQAFFTEAPEFTYIIGNGDSITDWSSIPPEGLQEGTRVLTNNNGDMADEDPRIQECIAVIEEAQGIEVIPTEELPDGDPNYYSGSVGACRSVSLFVQLAEAAGADLTNESWIAALDKVPDLELPGYEFVSLDSTKVDARDQLVLVEFDLPTLTFEPISDPIDIG